MAEKTAIVTGASRGIGRAIALELAGKGYKVILNYCGSKVRAEQAAEEICAAGGQAKAVQCDVSDYIACETFISNIIKEEGRIDVLVNNAGITRDGLLMKMSEEDFDAVINTNLKGCFHCMRFVSRQMLKQRSGRIINLSSVLIINNIFYNTRLAKFRTQWIYFFSGIITFQPPVSVFTVHIIQNFFKSPCFR